MSAAVAAAQTLTVNVVDHRGRPVDDAIVSVFPTDTAAKGGAGDGAVMDQIDESFAPHILVVPTGTPVSFPNHDDVRHHVYSFSDAKKFELPLYEGTPTDPVIFDQSGVVVLGCNIHDWMRGYIYVTDASSTARSVEGKATLELGASAYRVEVWHPLLRSKENWTATVDASSGGAQELSAEIRLKPALKIRRAPKAGKTKY